MVKKEVKKTLIALKDVFKSLHLLNLFFKVPTSYNHPNNGEASSKNPKREPSKQKASNSWKSKDQSNSGCEASEKLK